MHEGLITREESIDRIAGIDLAALVQVSLVSAETPLLTGIGASGGIAAGRAAFSSESARRLSAAGDPVILMRPDTSTADVEGFALAAGIVTSVGARTAHAALVARQMGKPCIVGCSGMAIEVAADRAQLAGTMISGSDWITIDGDSGNIYLGQRETTVTRPEAELAEIAAWRAKTHDDPCDSESAHGQPARLRRERKKTRAGQ